MLSDGATVNLRKYAKGKPCMIQLWGICNGNPETTVLAHYRRGHYAMSSKPHDILGAWACSACHDEVDRRTRNLEPEFADHEFLRGVVKTQRALIDEGVIE